MPLSPARYLAHIRDESARFREVLTVADPAARVPGCPDWDADDLLWHLTTVQQFWATMVIDRPSGPDDYEEPTRPDLRDDLFSAFDPDNLFDTAVSHRYRDTILAAGGSKDAADLVTDFLGRAYSFDAYESWLAR